MRTFVLSPGRSGSHSFAAAWTQWTGIPCDIPGHNEPFVSADMPLPCDPELYVQQVLAGLPENYAHAGIQGPFGHGLAPWLCKAGANLVYLQREAHEVAASLQAMEMVPGVTERGRKYHPAPPSDCPNPALWAALECEKLAYHCRKVYPQRVWIMPTALLPIHLNSLADRKANPHENDPFT